MNSCVAVSSRVAISGKRHRLQARREHHAGDIRKATSGAVRSCAHAAAFAYLKVLTGWILATKQVRVNVQDDANDAIRAERQDR
jgi:hypothetical protein